VTVRSSQGLRRTRPRLGPTLARAAWMAGQLLLTDNGGLTWYAVTF
jgi:hypothetical protein